MKSRILTLVITLFFLVSTSVFAKENTVNQNQSKEEVFQKLGFTSKELA